MTWPGRAFALLAALTGDYAILTLINSQLTNVDVFAGSVVLKREFLARNDSDQAGTALRARTLYCQADPTTRDQPLRRHAAAPCPNLCPRSD